ncbi:MAG: hypothetical protein PUP92_04455 [Rhizonema sp. PD38]|nr:hypothetical protein [Rhizonema sp. PD38]
MWIKPKGWEMSGQTGTSINVHLSRSNDDQRSILRLTYNAATTRQINRLDRRRLSAGGSLHLARASAKTVVRFCEATPNTNVRLPIFLIFKLGVLGVLAVL